MANPDHVTIVKSGRDAIANWRLNNPSVRLDLSGADLRKLDLRDAGSSARQSARVGTYLDVISSAKTGAERERLILGTTIEGVANLSLADLSDANLNNAQLRGVNLIGANLISARLEEADLGNALLRSAILECSHMDAADLWGADLVGADLSNAALSFAKLMNTNLTDASLRGAFFTRTQFQNTLLDAADFSHAHVNRATFADVDLSKAIGLDSVTHYGPSTIGVDAIWRSHGKIPAEFLRGAGLSDDLITYLPSLLGTQSPIQFYSCFISYSHKDEEFCKRLYSRMLEAKMRVWYASEDMPGGKKLHDEIDHAIRVHEKLLLVLSQHSMKSEWVKTEIGKARKRERQEGKQILFPIRLVAFDAISDWELFDADEGKDLAKEIREYFIPDFSKWQNNDQFEKAFQKLLFDMQANDK